MSRRAKIWIFSTLGFIALLALAAYVVSSDFVCCAPPPSKSERQLDSERGREPAAVAARAV
jgi:hypothetical protein